MVPDGRTDGRNGRTDGRTHGRRQNYIPPTSSGDNNVGWKIPNDNYSRDGHLEERNTPVISIPAP